MNEYETLRSSTPAKQLKWFLGCVMETVRDGAVVVALAAAFFALTHLASMVLDQDANDAPAVIAVERPAESPLEPAIRLESPEHRALAAHLSQRYRVAPDAAEEVVSAARVASTRVGLDPLLVLAVIAIESSFDPNAVSLAGAEGLMQVVPRYHEDTLEEHGGIDAVRDPTINILVGVRILDQYIRRAGSLEAGLQRYNGALSDGSGRYARKVLAERERLRMIVNQFERKPLVF
jgi:soluble lytic murein transglycosylase-like protein